MFAAKSRPDQTVTRTRNSFAAAALAVLVTMPAAAQIVDLDRLPWTINSETMSFDGKTSTIIYTGLQFSQGEISIEADEGRAMTVAQEVSTWNFRGNVIIDLNNGHIECETAELRFAGSVLTSAVVTGDPATFELTRADADDATYAEAGLLSYDVSEGVVEFSENATITESGNEISSNFLVYNILDRRINADSSGIGDDRVRITYTPVADPDVDEADPSDETESDTP